MHVISIAQFSTANAFDNPNEFAVRKAYIETARKLLQPHGIAVEQTALAPAAPYVLSWRQSVNDERDGGALRQMCQKEGEFDLGKSIPVIFCMLYQAADYGATILTGAPQNDGQKWGPYILINVRMQSRYNAVLLHELIHAAYDNRQPGHDGEQSSIFASCAPDRDENSGAQQTWLPARHLNTLRGASFAKAR